MHFGVLQVYLSDCTTTDWSQSMGTDIYHSLLMAFIFRTGLVGYLLAHYVYNITSLHDRCFALVYEYFDMNGFPSTDRSMFTPPPTLAI